MKARYIGRMWVIVVLFAGCGFEKGLEPGKFDIEDQYIVVFKSQQVQMAVRDADQNVNSHSVVKGMVESLANQSGVQATGRVFSKTIAAAVYKMSSEKAQELAFHPSVAYIEKDEIISIDASQNDPPWGLDRVDQADLPLSDSYEYLESGVQVNAYIIDTGIRISHNDFDGRAVHGIDTADDDADATDCNGHGTHVAGTVGGRGFGVAKNTKLYGVRVLDCRGSGRTSDVIAGVEWVTENHVKPAVANMSLGGRPSQALDDSVRASIAAGVTYAVAAGNENESACGSSPARVAQAFTVGSTTKSDRRSSFSNYGSCVDVFAPGSDIQSAWYNSNSSTKTISGTSMASPHVAGVAALFLSQNPEALPEEVMNAVLQGAVDGKIADVRSGSPNLLLNSLFVEENEDDDNEDGDNDDGDNDDDAGLENNVPVANLAGTQASEVVFSIVIPNGARNLKASISGGSGDADLYVKQGEAPDLQNYDCRPYKWGNEEVCELPAPQPGAFYVMLRGYESYEGVTLQVSYEEVPVDEDAPCESCEFYWGELSGREDAQVHPPEAYRVDSGMHEVWLQGGPESSDFDVELLKWDGQEWVRVANSILTRSEEHIRFSGGSGDYQVRVYSYRGSGAYKLWIQHP